MNGGPMHTETLAGPFTPGQTIQHTFLSTEDLSAIGGAFHFNISATVAGDENLNNDTISANVFKRYVRELEIVGIKTDACSDTTFAIVTLSIRNNGVGSPHTFDLDYTLNGIQQSPITGNSTPTLPDETEDFPMFVPNLHYGLNTLNVKLFNVDGAGVDEVPTNNSADLSFFVAPELKPLQVFLSFDSKPQETSWEILNSAGTVIASGSAYEDPFGGKIATACLEKDSCYVFKLHDSGGDGMDPGYVSLTLDNATLYEFSGGNFGSELIVPFCANTACANFSLIADITPATGANTNDGKIVAVPINGVAPFLFYIDNGDPQPSPVFDNLTPGLYHLYCVDANGCTSELLFSIGTVGTQNPILARTIKANPNPTIGIAHIEIAAMGNEKQATCTVFDNEGKKVQVCAMSRWDDTLHGNIALDRFPAGVYWLRVSGLDRIYTSKIVKR